MALIFSIFTFLSTFLGGVLGIKYKDKLHLILGFTAGVLLSLVAFDIFPEIIRIVRETNIDIQYVMLAFVGAFLIFHIVEKSLLIHNAHEDSYGAHTHPTVGIFSALALSGHSFLDGVGIGLAFQISSTIGFIVALAVIAHDFSDGLNTASLMLLHKNSKRKAFILVFIDAIAPVLGVLSTYFFTLPEKWLAIYLGFFAGFLLYISASDILPEAHREKSSYLTLLMTVIGVIFIFIITRFN